jgi:hypothetical protein
MIIGIYSTTFLDCKTYFYPWKILYKILMGLMFWKCVNMTFQATEIPAFADVVTAVTTTDPWRERNETSLFVTPGAQQHVFPSRMQW